MYKHANVEYVVAGSLAEPDGLWRLSILYFYFHACKTTNHSALYAKRDLPQALTQHIYSRQNFENTGRPASSNVIKK